MVDTMFSFGELGFQEVETSKYLTGMLEKEGLQIERGIAGIPTAWMATWGSGKPVIALGSDIDCIPQASQKPGVAYHDPHDPGRARPRRRPQFGPGGEHHCGAGGEGADGARAHQGTLKIWPGVAEEELGTKAYYVRAGIFKDVDIVLFAHVGNNLAVIFGAGAAAG